MTPRSIGWTKREAKWVASNVHGDLKVSIQKTTIGWIVILQRRVGK